MKLHVHDTDGLVDVEFGNWLIPILQSKLTSNLHKYNFHNWTRYLNETDSISRLYTSYDYDAKSVILQAIKCLVCKGSSGDITISIDSKKFVSGFDRVNLYSLTKMINYGNLEIKGCTLFTDTFNEVANTIESYVQLYYTF